MSRQSVITSYSIHYTKLYEFPSVAAKFPAEPLPTVMSPTTKPVTSSENSKVTLKAAVELTPAGAFWIATDGVVVS